MTDPARHVLWLTPQPPNSLVGGGGIRQAHLLKALARHSTVDLVVAGPDQLNDQSIRDVCRTVVEHVIPDNHGNGPVSNRLGYLRSMIGPEGPRELYVARDAARVVNRELDRLSATTEYDVVIVQHAAFLRLLPPRRRSRWVAEMHRFASRDMAQLKAITSQRRHRWFYEHEARAAAKLERWMARHYDLVVGVSNDDLQHLSANSVVIPNGVDTKRITGSALVRRPSVVMTGVMSTLPNSTGALWLCNEVMPRVQETVPDVELRLVGAAPTPEVTALSERPGVSLHIDVPDVLPYLAAARVAVVPLVMGSGTRLKALEAFAAGRPVVGTTIGLEGLGIIDGKQALVADDADEFAAKLVSVLMNDDVARRLARAGLQVAKDNDWERLGKRYVRAVFGESSSEPEASPG